MEKYTDPGAALADLSTVRELFAMCLQVPSTQACPPDR